MEWWVMLLNKFVNVTYIAWKGDMNFGNSMNILKGVCCELLYTFLLSILHAVVIKSLSLAWLQNFKYYMICMCPFVLKATKIIIL